METVSIEDLEKAASKPVIDFVDEKTKRQLDLLYNTLARHHKKKYEQYIEMLKDLYSLDINFQIENTNGQ